MHKGTNCGESLTLTGGFWLVLVAVLIGIMISIVVGTSLVPVIAGATTGITYQLMGPTTMQTITAPGGVQALVSVLPYIFVAVILLGAVAWIGGQG